jgi:hypothetical protein
LETDGYPVANTVKRFTDKTMNTIFQIAENCRNLERVNKNNGSAKSSNKPQIKQGVQRKSTGSISAEVANNELKETNRESAAVGFNKQGVQRKLTGSKSAEVANNELKETNRESAVVGVNKQGEQRK